MDDRLNEFIDIIIDFNNRTNINISNNTSYKLWVGGDEITYIKNEELVAVDLYDYYDNNDVFEYWDDFAIIQKKDNLNLTRLVYNYPDYPEAICVCNNCIFISFKNHKMMEDVMNKLSNSNIILREIGEKNLVFEFQPTALKYSDPFELCYKLYQNFKYVIETVIPSVSTNGTYRFN